MDRKRILGGTLLVAGTSIGAGMLALPVVTALGGFWPALFIYFLCWLFMSCTGLLLLELCLKLPPDANLVSMASHYLGLPGRYLSWALYLFLFYCLSIAYISGGGGLLSDWLSLPAWQGEALFLLLLAPIIAKGAKAVGRCNAFLMFGLIAAYFAFLLFGLPLVELAPLKRADWSLAWGALPVIFTSFSYQGVIPSLATYLHRDPKAIRLSILLGTSFAFLIYLIWEILILGIVPLDDLAQAQQLGLTAVTPLRHSANIPALIWIGQAFAFFAITTSFLGVNLGLLDFLADGLHLPKKGIRQLFLAFLTFAPSLSIALCYPSLFITALVFAGGIGCALLLGLMPIAMTWVSRYKKGEIDAPFALGGGRVLLAFLSLFVFFELILEFVH